MIVYVELNDNVKNADQFWSKLRLGLDELKMQLPTGVVALIGSNDFGDTAALLITMSSEGKKNEIINGFADWVYEEELSLS